jgi:hypothetical protein
MNLRKEAESLAKIVIPLYGTKLIIQVLNASVLAQMVGSIDGPGSPMWWAEAARILSVIAALVVPVGVGVWLFIRAQANGYSRWLWGLFGIAGGLFAAAIFCLVRLAEQTSINKSLNSTPQSGAN